jgi:hypothetical protein
MFFFSQTGNRHFDRSRSQPYRERQSGKIRFSPRLSLRCCMHFPLPFATHGKNFVILSEAKTPHLSLLLPF